MNIEHQSVKLYPGISAYEKLMFTERMIEEVICNGKCLTMFQCIYFDRHHKEIYLFFINKIELYRLNSPINSI